MEIVTIPGYAGAVIIGISLGLTGGGGSILTVPILVYLFALNPVLSTAYSLFIVGTTSLVGGVKFMKKGLVAYRAVLAYGLPSFVAVFFTRKYLVPAIPDPVLSIAAFELSKNVAIMVFFAIIMLAASFSMIRDRKEIKQNDPEKPGFQYPALGLQGAVVGVVTGIVGAGGGFLIVPALVLLAKLPMKVAIGTSLMIIAANSLVGFLGDLTTRSIDWPFILSFTAFSLAGIFIGSWLSTKIDGRHLKKGFGWFVLLMGIYILSKELFL